MDIQPNPIPIYSGRNRHVLDKKHRVTIPARWRSGDGKEEEFFIVPDQTNSYLMILTPEEFRKVEDTVNKREDITPPDRRDFIRWFYSSAQQCFVDKQGRLLLPEEHRKQVGLKDNDELVIAAGGKSRFEIWNSKRWDDNQKVKTPACARVSELVGL